MRRTHWSRQKVWSKVADTFLVVIEKEMCRFVQRGKLASYCLHT